MFRRRPHNRDNINHPELVRAINLIGAPPVKERSYVQEVLNDLRKLKELKGVDSLRILELAERRRFNDLIEGVVVPIAEAFKEAPADRAP